MIELRWQAVTATINNVKILVLGSGAREHAIVKRLTQDDQPHEITVAPGNAGIATIAQVVALTDTDPAAVAAWVEAHPQDLVVVGPEAPLVAGVADAVRALGVAVFGPDQAAANLEGSKQFAKEIMDAAGVPTGGARVATTVAEAAAALTEFGSPYVVKADGLAAGKGVLVTSDYDAALAHAEHWISQGVLIEEFLAGHEVSLFFVSDGSHIAPLDPGQDYKRLADNDEGPNTGGMGAYSPLPWLPEGFVEEVRDTIAQPTIDELAKRGTPFVGLLYCGLIITEHGIKVIEFNARFGDPETLVILPRLKGEFGQLLLDCASGNLHTAPEFDADLAAVAVVVASAGYPSAAQTGRAILGVDKAEDIAGVSVIHAATKLENGELLATGGRVLDVVGTGASLAEAHDKAYLGIAAIELLGSQHRTDIAKRVI